MFTKSFQDKNSVKKVFLWRIGIAVIVITGLLILLLSHMAYLQIVLHDKYVHLSENNRIKLQPVEPVRGLIYDRRGVLLAKNILSYRLTLIPEKIKDMSATLTFLSTLIRLNDSQIEKFNKQLIQARRLYEPVILKYQLNPVEMARMQVNRYFLPGVDIEAKLIREYPFGAVFSHALGYVGRMDDTDKQRFNTVDYRATTHVGKTGIERYYETSLHGTIGYQQIETNARGRILRIIKEQPPVSGKDIRLHLDSQIQQVASKAMRNYRGAVVAIEVKSGGILALYSNPSYDSNKFVTGISHDEYNQLRDNKDVPLFNRAIQGQYPPGSVIKPFIALSFLESGLASWSYHIEDTGGYYLEKERRYYRDWKRQGHGQVNLHRAIVESCDTYFYVMALRTGIDTLSPFIYQFGFGRNETFDIPYALSGVLPNREWKRKIKHHHWYAGDTLNFAIGQGYTLVTPLQLAVATAVLANRGVWKRPRLLKREGNSNPLPIKEPSAVRLKNDDHWDKLFAAMQDVVMARKGTARSINQNLTFSIAGKTGTAQIVGIKQDEEYDSSRLYERQRDHALFIAFAPVDDPKIAVAVIVENGESAGKTAAPVARKVMEAYFDIEKQFVR